MRKPVSPWSIRGVGHDVRTQAAKAAGRKRVYLGEWVSQAILAVAETELGVSPRAGASQPADSSQGLAEAVRALTRRLDREDESEVSLATLAERLETLESRLGEIERRDQALAALTERLVEEEKTTHLRLGLLARSLSLILSRTENNGNDGNDAVDRKIESLAELVLRLAQRKNGCADTAAVSEARETIGPESTRAVPIYDPGFSYADGGHQKGSDGMWSRLFGAR